jgi:phosphoribosylanthranilate isomerase
MTRVKICGLTTLEDAHQAVELGAWALGMIFWPGSPRMCPVEQAEAIGAQLHRQVELAGVFVNAPLDEVAATADLCRFSLLQLHGDEGPAYCQEAARRTGCKVIKAARVHDAAQIQALRAYHTDYHLLDAHSPRAPGGTGESFDWELARLHPGTPPVILSGGLTPDNVSQAIAAADPFAVDTASGTEAEPGRKDPDKLVAFFRAVEPTGNVRVVREAAGRARGGASP